jgi:hypothetical protein
LAFLDNNDIAPFTTTQVFRDVGSWYHIVLAFSTAESGTDKVKLWVNGSQVTSFSTDNRASVTTSGTVNTSDEVHEFGAQASSSTANYGGYLADVHFIDGQAKAASDFAETDSNGQLVPKAYTGSYGDNGFHLDFSDSADLGADAAGSNDFTATNLGSHDQMADSPNNNFATMNPIGDIVESVSTTFSEGNLTVSSGYRDNKIPSTIGVSSGKWYAEVRFDETGDQFAGIGREDSFVINGTYLGGSDGGISHAVYITDGYVYTDYSGVDHSFGAFSAGDVMNIALDLDSGTKKVWFGKNGTWSGTPGSSGGTTVVSGTWFFGQSYRDACTWNFGQDSTFNNTETVATNADDNSIGQFHSDVPAGFLALCTANLPAPGVNNAISSEKSFAVATWDGTYDFDNSAGTEEQNIDIGFNPGIVWVKDRENWAGYSSTYYDSYGHWLFDIIQGPGYALDPSSDADESASRSSNALISPKDGISSFAYTSGAAKGFTVDAPETNFNVDTDFSGSADTAASYVGWAWKLGSTGGTGTEEYNAAAGVSVVKWSGDGDGDDDVSIPHSLGVAPEMIWASDLSGYDMNAATLVWHKDLEAGNYLLMSENYAQDTDDGYYFQNPPNGATTLDVSGYLNYDTYDYQAYLFRSVEGYSKVGSYTANDLDNGPFIYCGFRPAFIICKRYDGGDQNWIMFDTARGTYNIDSPLLYPNLSNAEDSNETIDILSNGFKYREDEDGGNDTDGDKFIFYAVAENPFKYANAR